MLSHPFEFALGAGEVALDGGFVDEQTVEVRGVGENDRGLRIPDCRLRIGGAVLVSHFGLPMGWRLAHGALAGGEDGLGFEAQGAAEAPVAGGDGVDEGFLGVGLRAVVVEQAEQEDAELLADFMGVIVAQNQVAGEEAVFEGVAGGTGLAFGRAGAGGLPGVGAVGGELGGAHGFAAPGQRGGCFAGVRVGFVFSRAGGRRGGLAIEAFASAGLMVSRSDTRDGFVSGFSVCVGMSGVSCV